MKPGDLVRLKEGTVLFPTHTGDADTVQIDVGTMLATVIATKPKGWYIIWTYDCLWHARGEHLAPTG